MTTFANEMVFRFNVMALHPIANSNLAKRCLKCNLDFHLKVFLLVFLFRCFHITQKREQRGEQSKEAMDHERKHQFVELSLIIRKLQIVN